MFIATKLEEESIVRVRAVGGIAKNQSHLSGLKTVVKMTVKVGIVKA